MDSLYVGVDEYNSDPWQYDSDFEEGDDTPRPRHPLDQSSVFKRLTEIDGEIWRIRCGPSASYGLGCHVEPTSIGLGRRSSVDKLPIELLQEVFLKCLPWALECDCDSDTLSATEDTLDRHNAPWTLVQVCNKWRHLALNLPRLWSCLVVRPATVQSEIGIKILLLSTHLLLKHSVQLPLFIRFQSTSSMHMMERSEFQGHWFALLDALIDHSERWQDVGFQMPALFQERLSVVKERLPLLEKVHIQPNDVHGHKPLAQFDAFMTCPKLSSFSFYAKQDMPPKIPWFQLTRFSGTLQTPKTLELLKSAQSLVYLHLRRQPTSRIPRITDFPAVYRFSLPALHTLEVRGSAEFLNSLTLPQLRILTLGVACQKIECVVSMIERSECKLTSLTLSMRGVEESDVLMLFGAVPTITSVSIELLGRPFTDKFLDRLTYDSSSPSYCLLPMVQSWHVRSPIHYLGAPFQNMIRSRTSPAPNSVETMPYIFHRLKMLVADIWNSALDVKGTMVTALKEMEGVDFTVAIQALD